MRFKDESAGGLADVIQFPRQESELTADVGWLVAEYGWDVVQAELEMHRPVLSGSPRG